MGTILIVIGVVFLVALLSIWTSKTKTSSLSLPPGPPRIPFLGNALDIDNSEPHLTYTKWGRQYGDLVYSQILGQGYIIVNSEKVAKSLSDTRRSAVYADRPKLVIYKLLGIESTTGTLPYGDTFRVHRKLCHETLRSDAIIKYQPVYMNKAISLVQNLLQDGASSKLHTILQVFAATTVLSLTYGHDIKSEEHPVVKLVKRLNNIIAEEVTAEKASLLQTFPFVKYLPSWLPGLGFLDRVALGRKLAKDVLEQPFAFTKSEVAAGTAPHSMVADFLTSHEEDEDSELYQELEAAMKAAAATFYRAGVETSSSMLHTLILAMILFPDVQEKARAEIDAVIGKDRLPTFGDRDSLPYIEAMMCETLRWHPPIPLGLPHATTRDDMYEGFHIPKGTIIIFNAWAMSRDCVNPDHFDPGRHLLPTGELSPTARMSGSPFFGFGRRVCPGRFFAEDMLWAAFVQIFATLHFSKATNTNGRLIDINPVFSNGVTSHPVPFQFSITGTERARLIND